MPLETARYNLLRHDKYIWVSLSYGEILLTCLTRLELVFQLAVTPSGLHTSGAIVSLKKSTCSSVQAHDEDEGAHDELNYPSCSEGEGSPYDY